MTAFALASLPPIGGWKITGQQQQVRAVTGNPRPVDGFVINFVTGYGVNSSVFIASADYSVANVQAAVAAQVAQLDAVSALTHESVT